MLSRAFDAGQIIVGLSSTELAGAAQQIQSGAGYQFDSKQLARVVALHLSAKSIGGRRLVVEGLRWLAPPLLLLAGLLWVIWHGR